MVSLRCRSRWAALASCNENTGRFRPRPPIVHQCSPAPSPSSGSSPMASPWTSMTVSEGCRFSLPTSKATICREVSATSSGRLPTAIPYDVAARICARHCRRPDLAASVTWVSEFDDTLGYDIQSFNLDESSRHVEVKGVAQAWGALAEKLKALRVERASEVKATTNAWTM